MLSHLKIVLLSKKRKFLVDTPPWVGVRSQTIFSFSFFLFFIVWTFPIWHTRQLTNGIFKRSIRHVCDTLNRSRSSWCYHTTDVTGWSTVLMSVGLNSVWKQQKTQRCTFVAVDLFVIWCLEWNFCKIDLSQFNVAGFTWSLCGITFSVFSFATYHVHTFTSTGNPRLRPRLPMCISGQNKVVFDDSIKKYGHAPSNLPFICLVHGMRLVCYSSRV